MDCNENCVRYYAKIKSTDSLQDSTSRSRYSEQSVNVSIDMPQEIKIKKLLKAENGKE